MVLRKNQDIQELKAKVAEAMALLPSNCAPNHSSPNHSPHFSSTFTNIQDNFAAIQEDDVLSKSSLNPNASDYTPMCGK